MNTEQRIHLGLLESCQDELQLPHSNVILDITSRAAPSCSPLAYALAELQHTQQPAIVVMQWETLAEEQQRLFSSGRSLKASTDLNPLMCGVGAVVFENTFNQQPRYGGIPIDRELTVLLNARNRLVRNGLCLASNSQFGSEDRYQRIADQVMSAALGGQTRLLRYTPGDHALLGYQAGRRVNI